MVLSRYRIESMTVRGILNLYKISVKTSELTILKVGAIFIKNIKEQASD